MQVENHKEEVPFSYYENLFREFQPQSALDRLPGVTFEDGQFTITLLGRTYRISWPEYAIAALDDGPAPTLPTQTFLLRLLLEAKEIPWCGTWKTFREMPWGEMYNTPFTGRCLTRSAFTFGTRINKFRAACEKLGAKKLPHGDAGYEFQFFGPYAMQILIWEGDDEFPPNAQIIYSENFAQGFAAEDRVVAGDILIGHIKSNM
ncbi:MAG: DUF3786 domain-containing protein [Ruminococcaceae bacterium]|nr:DUF3786 domain-containing protein [Oscillospiraceae bacterium]